MLALVCQMLAVDCDLSHFTFAVSHIPWLAPLVTRREGAKPPRYPTLWEACANAIIFQRISLRPASAIMQRVVLALGQPVEIAEQPTPCFVFPSAESFQTASFGLLRAAILIRIKGIGPWSAAVILLRGLGRLDVFPANDTSVASNIALVAGSAPFDAQAVLNTLGPQRGMLFFICYSRVWRPVARSDVYRPNL